MATATGRNHSDDAKLLTTFITPWGRFRFCCNQKGLISAGDEVNRCTGAAFASIPKMVEVLDDCLVRDTSFQDHVRHSGTSRPRVVTRDLIIFKIIFFTVCVSLSGLGPSETHEKFSMRKVCDSSSKKQGEKLILL